MTRLLSQARRQIERSIARREFARGDVLPSKADLAARLGCSAATVDRALVDLARRGVVQRVRRKGTVVLGVEATRKLGRAILLQAHDEHTNLLLTEPVFSALSRRGFDVDVVPMTSDPNLAADRCMDLTQRNRPAEFAVSLDSPPPARVLDGARQAAMQRLAGIIDRLPWRVAFDVFDRPVAPGTHLVAMDQFHAARQVVDHLLEQGHRRIAIEAGANPGEDAWPARIAHVARRLIEMAGGRMTPLFQSDWGQPDTLRRWRHRHRPTALWMITDYAAMLIAGRLHGLGAAVPEDVSLVGRNDTPWARLAVPPLTTVSIDPPAVADAIADVLVHAARHDAMPERPLTHVAPQLIVRQSTAPVRKSLRQGERP